MRYQSNKQLKVWTWLWKRQWTEAAKTLWRVLVTASSVVNSLLVKSNWLWGRDEWGIKGDIQENVLETGEKRDACYIMLESLVTRFYAAMWRESMPHDGDDLTKDISKQSVEGATWVHLPSYSKMQAERCKLKRMTFKQKRTKGFLVLKILSLSRWLTVLKFRIASRQRWSPRHY